MTMLTEDLKGAKLRYLGRSQHPGFLQFEKEDLRIFLGNSLGETYIESDSLILTSCHHPGPLAHSTKCLVRVPSTMLEMYLTLHQVRPSIVLKMTYLPGQEYISCHLPTEINNENNYVLKIDETNISQLASALMQMNVLEINLPFENFLKHSITRDIINRLGDRFGINILSDGSFARLMMDAG